MLRKCTNAQKALLHYSRHARNEQALLPIGREDGYRREHVADPHLVAIFGFENIIERSVYEL